MGNSVCVFPTFCSWGRPDRPPQDPPRRSQASHGPPVRPPFSPLQGKIMPGTRQEPDRNKTVPSGTAHQPPGLGTRPLPPGPLDPVAPSLSSLPSLESVQSLTISPSLRLPFPFLSSNLSYPPTSSPTLPAVHLSSRFFPFLSLFLPHGSSVHSFTASIPLIRLSSIHSIGPYRSHLCLTSFYHTRLLPLQLPGHSLRASPVQSFPTQLALTASSSTLQLPRSASSFIACPRLSARLLDPKKTNRTDSRRPVAEQGFHSFDCLSRALEAASRQTNWPLLDLLFRLDHGGSGIPDNAHL